MIQPAIFEDLQRKIDDEQAVKDTLREIVQDLEKQSRTTLSILSRTHSTPSAELSPIVNAAETSIGNEIVVIKKLAEVASKHPYYRYCYAWSRQVQESTSSILLCGWLGGFGKGASGQLLTIEEVGGIIGIPVNVKDQDAFHLTIEEYLLALISLLDELGRLARNSVTMSDYGRPLQISQFTKDVHAGFQILNLRNDGLRKRSDGIKYKIKEVEEIVYDLSLRGLLPKE